MSTYLVTGGAGFVGSHTVLALLERGDEVVVVDNLTLGHRAAVLQPATLMVTALEDYQQLSSIFRTYKFDAVLHFAALSLIGESMREPLRYCAKNAFNAFNLADLAIKSGCSRFILSSTANVYSTNVTGPIDEATPTAPNSAYGESKLMIEQGLLWAKQLHGLEFATLRYFNASGADPDGRIGEDHDPETHLIPLAIDAAMGRRPHLTVYGDDYPTPDGSCIRDYIHVKDLADAHLRLLDMPLKADCYNVGSGHGFSVLDVLAVVERVTGRKVPYVIGGRRPGDPATLVASAARLTQDTGWRARFSDLESIVGDAFRWREAHPYGYTGHHQPISATRAKVPETV